MIDILHSGYRLNKQDYEELLVRYAPNRNALRLISESATDRDFIIRGIPSREEEEQALTNYTNGIRNYIFENDAMKRRYMDSNDIEAAEKMLITDIDPKRLEVTKKPKTLEEAWSQDLRYDRKVSQLERDKEAILEEQIIGSIFDGNKEEAEKLSKVQNLYNMTTEERKEKLRQTLVDALTPDMIADLRWMRNYKNQDVDADVTDSELSYLMSGDYRTIYEDRAAENGKESDYPDFLQFFKDFHDESEADPKNK